MPADNPIEARLHDLLIYCQRGWGRSQSNVNKISEVDANI